MAVTLTTIQSGARHHIVHVYAAGANSDAVVVDASAINATDSPITKLRLMKVQWAIDSSAGEAATLEWDQTADAALFICPEGEGSQSFEDVGGIPNPVGAGTTGDVVMTNAAGLTAGTFLLHFHKQ